MAYEAFTGEEYIDTDLVAKLNQDYDACGKLASKNTWTGSNVYNKNITVSNGTASGSEGIIDLGKPPTSKTKQPNIYSPGNGNLIINASENSIIALQSGDVVQWSIVSDETNTKTSAYLHSNLAATYTPATGVVWEGNANTATKLATARTINGVPFDGTKNITIKAGQGEFLPLTGGTVTGPIYLPSTAPTTDTQAVTKKYVDDSVAGAGGGYAQLNSANTFTAANTFNSNIVVRAATAAGSAGIITLGEKPSDKTEQCLIHAGDNGNLILQASENRIVALQSGSVPQWSVESDEANTKTSAYLHSNLAATYTPATGVVWEGNANTATKLATARTINGVPFDGTKNITIKAGQGEFLPLTGGTVTGPIYLPSTAPTTDTQAVTKKYVDDSVAGAGGGYAQLNSANTFTAANTFNSNIVVRAATAAGSAGIITLGEKPSDKTEQCLIHAGDNGNLILQASENRIVALQSGSVPQWSVESDEANTKTSAYLHSNLAATYTPSGGVVWEGNAKTATTATSAKSATKLATARTITANLASSTAGSFDGSANIIVGVAGTLPIANGGTGATTAAAARTALGCAPAYTYSTTDLTAGSSALTTGTLYIVYE